MGTSLIFQLGDRIKSKDRGFTATIMGVNFDVLSDNSYTVEWDHIPGAAFDYYAKDVNDVWMHEDAVARSMVYFNPSEDTLLPKSGSDQPSYGSYKAWNDAYANCDQSAKTPETCNHNWATYDSGWTLFNYCTKCDAKKDERTRNK